MAIQKLLTICIFFCLVFVYTEGSTEQRCINNELMVCSSKYPLAGFKTKERCSFSRGFLDCLHNLVAVCERELKAKGISSQSNLNKIKEMIMELEESMAEYGCGKRAGAGRLLFNVVVLTLGFTFNRLF